jgi:hypothetical protein
VEAGFASQHATKQRDRAFSSEVATGSHEENATRQNDRKEVEKNPCGFNNRVKDVFHAQSTERH